MNWSYGPRGCRSDETCHADVQPLSQGSNTFTCDSDGRLASEPTSAGTTTYAYNDENELKGTSGPSPTASYTYDGNGQRASSTINGVMTAYRYNLAWGTRVLYEACSGTGTDPSGVLGVEGAPQSRR